MKTIVKILLIGFGTLLIFVIIAVVGISFIFTDSYNRTLDEKVVEGREFGKTTVKQGCLEKSLTRAKKAEHKLSEIKDLVADETFISSCLEAAAPDSHFCDGVPGMGMEFLKAVQGEVYEEQVCEKSGYGKHNSTCKMVFSAKQKFCWGK